MTSHCECTIGLIVIGSIEPQAFTILYNKKPNEVGFPCERHVFKFVMFKVDVHNPIMYLDWISIFERYEVRCGSKKTMCLKHIEPCAQNMVTIMSSIANIIGGRGGGT